MWDFFNARERVARKPYRCDEANCEIKPGDRYSYGAGTCDGNFMVQRLCLDCQLLATEFFCTLGYDEGFPLGSMREVLASDHGVTGDPIAWALACWLERLPREAAERRARAVARAHKPILEEISAERRRQIEVEGWTPEHDDGHSSEEMARAAASYVLSHAGLIESAFDAWLDGWGREWFKPNPVDSRRDLIKAAALILAEVERLDRRDAL